MAKWRKRLIRERRLCHFEGFLWVHELAASALARTPNEQRGAPVRYCGAFRIGVTSSWADRTVVDEFAARLQAAFATLTRAPATVAPVRAPKEAGEALPSSFAAG